MQVDLTTVVSILSGVLSVVFALYLAIAKYAIGQREKELDRRLDEVSSKQDRAHLECTAELKRQNERLGEAEKTAIHQEGKIMLVEQSQGELLSDIEEIKRTMVTKAEWEPRMNNMERTLNQILAELRGSPSRYASHGALSTQSPYPKKDPR